MKKKEAKDLFHCPSCGAEFNDDDLGFMLETGLCQHCKMMIVFSSKEAIQIVREYRMGD
jgi:hypothetical protein